MAGADQMRQYTERYDALKAELQSLGFLFQGSLQTRRIACGKTTCRCYHDPDARHGPYPRVLEIMRDIDDTLGGGIQWPDVYVTDGLSGFNLLGFHSPDLSEEDWYDLSDPTDGDYPFMQSAFGIHLLRDPLILSYEPSKTNPFLNKRFALDNLKGGAL